MKRLWWSSVCVLALGVASGCDDDNGGGSDAGTSDASVTHDAGRETAPQVLASVRDDEGDLTDQVPADYSCRGNVTAPAGDGESTFTIRAVDFQSGFAVAGLTVQFFPNNSPSTDRSCTAPCQQVTTNAQGEATVTGTAGAWYAYRILAGTGTNVTNGDEDDFVEVLQVNEITPADGGTARLNAVREFTRAGIVLLLGTPLEEGAVAVVGVAGDCMGREVANARIRVFNASGAVPIGFTNTGPREFYFDGSGSQPSTSQRMTNSDGLYGAANIPAPGDGELRVELWGSLTEGGEVEMLGCERVIVGPDAVSIVNLGPARSDGPAGCSGS